MKQLKVMLVNASTSQLGNTHEALKIAVNEFEKYGVGCEIFWIGDKHLASCKHCGECESTCRCTIDDPVREFTEKAKEADGFVFAAPLPRIKPDGSIVRFFERSFISNGDAFRLKPAAAMVLAIRTAKPVSFDKLNTAYFDAEMPLIGSIYWNLLHDRKEPESVAKDAEGVAAVRRLAKDMTYWMRCREAGAMVGILPPEKEKSLFEGMRFMRL